MSMYNIIHVMENVTNIALVGIVVLIVMFRNIGINLIGVTLVSLEGMQLRVGPQIVGVWGVLQPFADAVKLLAKESILPNHANQIIFLLAPIISLVLVLAGWAMFIFLLTPIISLVLVIILGELADINIGILYLFAVSSLGAYAVLCSGWASNNRSSFLGALRASFDCVEADSQLVSGFHTEHSAEFFVLFLFYVCSLALMIVGAITALNQSYIKRLLAYSAIAHVGYVLLALAVGTYTSIFSLLVFMIFYIITFISKSNLVMQLLASTVFISTITKALLYFQLHPYSIHLISCAFSIYILFF